MTAIALPFPIGTLTTQGIFLGMKGSLASFSKDQGNGRSMAMLCSPNLAKVITQAEEDAFQARCESNRGFFTGAIVLTGKDAREALQAMYA